MKLSSIKPIEIVNSHKAAEEIDINWFMINAHKFELVPCPGCGSDTTERKFKKGVVNYLVCKICGCNYISPRPNASLLASFYKCSANYNLSASELFKRPVYHAKNFCLNRDLTHLLRTSV